MAKRKHITPRHRKRNRSIVFEGKRIPIREYLKGVPSELPYMEITSSGKRIDHEKGLKKMFHKDGMEGVKRYIKHCQGTVMSHNQTVLSNQRKLVSSDEAKEHTTRWRRLKLSGLLWFRSVRLWIKRSWMNLSGKAIG